MCETTSSLLCTQSKWRRNLKTMPHSSTSLVKTLVSWESRGTGRTGKEYSLAKSWRNWTRYQVGKGVRTKSAFLCTCQLNKTAWTFMIAILFLGFAIPWGQTTPIHGWLPKSTTDPHHGFQICSNDALPFWAPKRLQKALSNERDVTKKNWSWFWSETVWISLWLLGLAIPWRQLSSHV